MALAMCCFALGAHATKVCSIRSHYTHDILPLSTPSFCFQHPPYSSLTTHTIFYLFQPWFGHGKQDKSWLSHYTHDILPLSTRTPHNPARCRSTCLTTHTIFYLFQPLQSRVSKKPSQSSHYTHDILPLSTSGVRHSCRVTPSRLTTHTIFYLFQLRPDSSMG